MAMTSIELYLTKDLYTKNKLHEGKNMMYVLRQLIFRFGEELMLEIWPFSISNLLI